MGDGARAGVMKTVRNLLPLAIVVAVAGVVTLSLLQANPGLGQWLLAALLLAHGWVHVMFVFPRPQPKPGAVDAMSWPFDLGGSWLATRAGWPVPLVRAAGRVLVVITMAGFLAAALATVGVLVPTAWWPALVLLSAAASTLLLGLCFSPTLLLGLAIDGALGWLVVSGTWRPV